MPGFRQRRCFLEERRSGAGPTNARKRAWFELRNTSFEVGGIIPHELKMDQPPKLPRILMVLSYAFATLCAVAASKSDLTDELYDVIIRLSLEKPACIRCTYWRRTARHYSVAGNDARFAAGSEYAGRLPGHSRPQHRETPLERFDRQSADGGVESDSTGDQ